MKINALYHINKKKEGSDMIISTDEEKEFNRLQYYFMINTQQSGNRREFPQLEEERL